MEVYPYLEECEGNDLYMERKESGVINEENIAESKVTLIYGQMNEPPGARMRVDGQYDTIMEIRDS